MSDQLEQLFSQLEAGHQAATNKPDPAELNDQFGDWLADAVAQRPGFAADEIVTARMDY